MRPLSELLQNDKKIRVIGFDDAPFNSARGSIVKVAGIVCSNTRFEGMLWGEVKKDGNDATEQLISLLNSSKFIDQVHLVLTDGIAVGGFNVIDLSALSLAIDRPCIAVMRKMPDFVAIDSALKHFNDAQDRKQMILNAGDIHSYKGFYFQVCGCTSDVAAKTLDKLTNMGNVPEALRLAHLIGSAVMTGQSSNRA